MVSNNGKSLGLQGQLTPSWYVKKGSVFYTFGKCLGSAHELNTRRG